MKPFSILWKLVFAFLLVAITATAIVAVFIRLTSVDRLTNLILDQQRSNLHDTLLLYYERNGSWQGLPAKWRQIQGIGGSTAFQAGLPTPQASGSNDNPQGPFGERLNQRDRRALFGLADADGKVIVAVSPGFEAGTQLNARQIKKGMAIEFENERVGTILTANLPPSLSPEESLFLRRTSDALGLAMFGAMTVALLIALLLARTLIRPLQALTEAAQRITSGQWHQQVEVRSDDEIGQLAHAFNDMSAELERVHSQRKQMTADIAHDLRTPLTVIAGYVESMRDGVLKPTPERLTLIYSEIERLQNLVGDLKMLSLADTGELIFHPVPTAVRRLLEQAAAPFQHHADQQSVALRVDAAADLPAVLVDEARMMQVFGNLITNALRYTPAGGEIVLAAVQEGQDVRLIVSDTGSGIDAQEIPFIFDRFRRADKSRHSDNGESGLGLAIVKALVEGQGGSISASAAPGMGTRIDIRFPKS